MSAIPNVKLTPAEYLAQERVAPFKSEFFNGEVFAIAGASREYNRIKENLVGELFAHLKGTPCRSYSSDLRLLVEATGLYTYPDIILVCGTEKFDVLDKDTLTNPSAVIEILSPSTERYDRGAKFRNYQQIESLVEYLLVAQDEPVCERYIRQEGGSWGVVSFVGLEASLVLTSVQAEIAMADIFAGVEFPQLRLR